MGEVVIYGASDDLVIVEGDVTEEYYAYDEPAVIQVEPLGLLVGVLYGHDGIWHVSSEAFGDYEHMAAGEHEYTDYSEAIRVRGEDLSVERVR